jgi:hypothetical protein
MNSAYLDLGPSGRISPWLSILESTKSHRSSQPSTIHTLKCLLFMYSSNVNEDGLHEFDRLISEIKDRTGMSWDSSQKRANRAMKSLIDGGVIIRKVLDDYPTLKNGKQPYLYTLADAASTDLGITAGKGATVSFQRQAILTKAYKSKLLSDPDINYISGADISVPVNTRLTTLLVGLGSRVSHTDTNLLVTHTKSIDGHSVNFRCYASGETTPEGDLLGRMYGRDARILYLIQTRDSQLIAQRIRNGDTDIKNRFTLDVHDLLSEIKDGAGENRGGSKVGISNAIRRIAEMSYTVEADSDSSISKAFSDINEAPTNKLYTKLLYLLASGDDVSSTKYERFFTYKHSDHVFNSMISSKGMWFFDRELITKNLGSYEQLFYILCRNNVTRGSAFVISLEQIYKDMLVEGHVSWKSFSDKFISAILIFSKDVDKITKGETCSLEFIGYSISITRPTGSLRSILFEIRQAGVENLENLTISDKSLYYNIG